MGTWEPGHEARLLAWSVYTSHAAGDGDACGDGDAHGLAMQTGYALFVPMPDDIVLKESMPTDPLSR